MNEGQSSNETILPSIPKEYRDNPEYYDNNQGTLNVGSRESNIAAQILSNFAPTPFTLDGISYASIEAFVQTLKSPNEDEQNKMRTLTGSESKKSARRFKTEIKNAYMEDENEEEPVGYVSNYQGIQIPFRSYDHYSLIERAIRAKFKQNPQAMESLLGNNKRDRRKITHILYDHEGKAIPENPFTSLPAEVFTTILMRIRNEEQDKNHH